MCCPVQHKVLVAGYIGGWVGVLLGFKPEDARRQAKGSLVRSACVVYATAVMLLGRL